MNQTSKEKLSDYLTEVDSDLLDAAMSADTPEKLAQYQKRYQKIRPLWLRTTAVAACAAILLGVFLLKDSTPAPGEDIHLDTPPVFQEGSGSSYAPSIPGVEIDPGPNINLSGITIKSVDMLNYYGAIYLLEQQAAAMPTAMSDSSGYSICRLNDTQPPQIIVPLPDETEPPVNTEPYPYETQGPPLTPPTAPTNPTNPKEEIYYYDFDREMTIFVTEVYFFQMEVHEDSYLADKIGVGVVDVVISNAVWDEYMITFKNGENYYSCLTNGYSPSIYMEFSTHKFIDGYRVVKNFNQENTSFTVSFGAEGQVDQVEEGYYTRSILPVVGQTYVAEVNASYTVEQLEDYFNNPTEA